MSQPRSPFSIAALLVALVLVLGAAAACNEESLPEGQEGVEELCGPYRAVASEFPFDVPPDLNNPGENLRARSALEQLNIQVASLHDAVRISQDTQATRAFGRYASAVEDAVGDAMPGTSGLNAPSDWLTHRDRLNEHEADAQDELRETLSGLGVNVRTTCDT